MPSSRNELLAFQKHAQMHRHRRALSNSSFSSVGQILLSVRGAQSSSAKASGFVLELRGLRTVFILSRKCPGFAEVCSGERILLLMGFGNRAVRKAALLRYK